MLELVYAYSYGCGTPGSLTGDGYNLYCPRGDGGTKVRPIGYGQGHGNRAGNGYGYNTRSHTSRILSMDWRIMVVHVAARARRC